MEELGGCSRNLRTESQLKVPMLTMIMTATSAAIGICRTQGPRKTTRITDANVATERATGQARADLVGRRFGDYFTDPERAGEAVRLAFMHGAVNDWPLILRHADGSLTQMQTNASVYRDANGAVAGEPPDISPLDAQERRAREGNTQCEHEP